MRSSDLGREPVPAGNRSADISTTSPQGQEARERDLERRQG